MHTKPLFYLICPLAIALCASTAVAGPHRGGSNNFASMRPRAGVARPFVGGNRFAAGNGQRWSGQRFVGQRFSGQRWAGQNWNRTRWSNNNWAWRHHHHFRDFDDFGFFDFGFPFWGWWGYPYYYDYYPYGYYPYGYPGDGYYDSGYYGSSGYNYGNRYNNSYGYTNGSNVTELQRKLRDAGYYHGPIDGIMGSRTYYALKAYRHDHANGRNTNGGYNPTLRDRPYSPPPITTEPSPGE
jgi:Putative peptidoglycan binding domain